MRRSPSSEPLSDGVEPLFSTTRRLFTTSTLEHGHSVVGELRGQAFVLQQDGFIGVTQWRRVMGMGDVEDGACTYPACSRPFYPILSITLGCLHLCQTPSMPSHHEGPPAHSSPSLPTMPSMGLGFGLLAWEMPCSPCRLLFGELDARHTAHPPDHHTEAVVASKDLDGAAHGDVLQAHAVHLCDLVTNAQPSLLCEGHTAQLGT